MAGHISRRTFLKTTGAAALASGLQVAHPAEAATRNFDISLAAWSLHRTIGGKDDQIPMLDMPRLAREEFGIGAIELVNRMLASTEKAYIDQFIRNAADHDVKILLIMIDGAGSVGTTSERGRQVAVDRHKEWIDIAAAMDCHSVRMNWAGYEKNIMEDSALLKEYIARSASPLRTICEYGDARNLNVIIENHWGPSSYPDALLNLIETVDHPRFGTLPDFGNFPDEVDRYDATDRMMPYAKAVSAKCYDFDNATGQETKIDFDRMLSIVVDKHGYHGHLGIEYEGNRLSEFEGIKACTRLLERLKG